jgi:hypothetical protein
MKATDFDLARDIKFNLETGITQFFNTRLLIFDADAIGLLRQEILDKVGWEATRAMFLRFGFQHGYADHMQMRVSFEFDTETDLLASGPVIHTWEGIVQASPLEISFDRDTGDFFFTGVWSNSYEADQYLNFNGPCDEPVCWSLMGYASGWCSCFFGRPLLAIEPVCVGKGDDHCEWKIQPPAVWGDVRTPYMDALGPLFKRIGG